MDAIFIWSWLPYSYADDRNEGQSAPHLTVEQSRPSFSARNAPDTSTPRTKDSRTAALRTNSESTTETSMQSIYEQHSFDPQDYRRWSFVAGCQAPKDWVARARADLIGPLSDPLSGSKHVEVMITEKEFGFPSRRCSSCRANREGHGLSLPFVTQAPLNGSCFPW